MCPGDPGTLPDSGGAFLMASVQQSIRRWLPAVVLLVVLGVAVLLVVRPRMLVETDGPFTIRTSGLLRRLLGLDIAGRITDPVPILLGVGSLTVGLALLVTLWGTVFGRRRGGPQVRIDADERTTGTAPSITAAARTDLFADSTDHDTPAKRAMGYRREVRAEVREAAIRMLGRAEGWSREEAARALAAGTWIDDPNAAALLADRSAVTVPWRTRIIDWLHPEPTFARRVDRTVTAIETYDAPGEGDGGD